MNKIVVTKSLMELVERLQAIVGAFIAVLSEPKWFMRVQMALMLLFIIWGSSSISRLLWSLWPSQNTVFPTIEIINPVSVSYGARRQIDVDLSRMLGLNVFGGAVDEVAPAEVGSRDGIEFGARESGLSLKLVGIIASTDDGLGSVVIEGRNGQTIYSVGEELPVSGTVILVKVAAKQVVLDNNGTYELLTLFEDNGLSKALAVAPTTLDVSATEGEAATVRINTQETIELAAGYRDEFYDNPQSLARIVSLEAVWGSDGIKGYRVTPGLDANQFRSLGFQSGDIVTAVNGLTLSDPTNTMQLYQWMRDATEVTFNIERDGGAVIISVSLK